MEVAEVIAACKNGNRFAQNHIYERFAPAMFNTAYRIVGSREEAEDVLQEGFVKAFTNIAALKENKAFAGWLKRIIVNHSLSKVKQKMYYDSIEEFEQADDLDDDDNYPYKNFGIRDIQNAIKELSVGYRTIVQLYLFEDFSHKEIAEQLNISVSTSKSQYHRAKSKIKSMLENRGI